jgi:methylmalonyl-CoA/ethylmalonyl-CoA epimerase
MISGLSKPLRLHHIGFVVASIKISAPGFVRALNANWNGEIISVPNQKVNVTFLLVSVGDALVELVEPSHKDAPVNKFLREKGPGLHHLCYEVDALDRVLAEIRSRGALLAKPPKPAIAFGGRQIAWVFTPEKLLVELLEAAKE